MKNVLIKVVTIALFCSILMMCAVYVSANATDNKCGDNLTWSVTLESGELIISGSGPMYDNDSMPPPWRSYSDNIKKIIISDEVTSIGSYSFSEFDSIKSVVIPKSVESIGDYAFSLCWELETVVISDSVKKIGDYAFCQCKSLESINLSNSVESIGDYAFKHCQNLNSLVIPDSVKSIGEQAFNSCSQLQSIIIPNSVESIGNYAFISCSALNQISLPDSLKDIGRDIFSGTAYTSDSINWSDGILYIGKYLISSHGLKQPPTTVICNVTNINSTISKEREITIKYGTKLIAGYAFFSCDLLTSVSLPDSLTIIGDSAFENASALEYVYIPAGVTSIGDKAVSDCPSLTVYYDENNSYAEDYCKKNSLKYEIGRCHQVITPKLGHNYSPDWTIDKKATYFEEGLKSHHCLRCEAKSNVTKMAMKKLGTPIIKLTAGTKKINVSYKKVQDANKYIISIKIDGVWCNYFTTKLNYLITGLNSKKSYTIKVQAIITNGDIEARSAYSKQSSVKTR